MAATAKKRPLITSPAATAFPHFETEEEEREFWSTHDTTPYWHLMEDVSDGPPPDVILRLDNPLQPARRRPEPGETAEVTLSLPTAMVTFLRAHARRRKLSVDSLIAEWLGERIDEERRSLNRGLDLIGETDEAS